MKKVFSILIFLAAISNGFCQTSIRMYSAPSTTSELIELITSGPNVKLIDSSINYYHKVEYNGKTGYISKSAWTVQMELILLNHLTPRNKKVLVETTSGDQKEVAIT